MCKINLRIGEETHAKWMQHCAEQGTTSSEAIREFIDKQVAEQLPPLRPKVQRKAQKKVEVSVWLTESEVQGIQLRQTLNGGSRAAWIIKVIRAALTRQPVFDDAETMALKESTAALNAIGKNLNQIARRLNEMQKAEQALDVIKVRNDIASHTDTVQALVDMNRSRWSIIA